MAIKKHRAVLSTVIVTLFLGVLTPQYAQDAPSKSADPELERRAVAIGLLRTINTAEVGELSKYGSYSPWQTLLAHQPKFFDGWLAMIHSKDANMRFGDAPEILPGWSLRFNVHADGKGYDVRLQDLADKACWYAALTDESGVIRQSKAIDCQIQ